jgi:ADP-ribosylglycohydrolase
MRVAPLGAYLHGQTVSRVAVEAERSAAVTHAHPEAKAGAVAVALAAWCAARSRGVSRPSVESLFALVSESLDPASRVAHGVSEAASLPSATPLGESVSMLGNGSHVTCADTVPLALWIAFVHLDDFAEAVRHAIASGGDTDTLAAIVGGIVAARVGVEGIPERWRAAVEPPG